MAEIRISNHARAQMMKRGISEGTVLDIISSPQEKIHQGGGRMIYQSDKYFELDKRNFTEGVGEDDETA